MTTWMMAVCICLAGAAAGGNEPSPPTAPAVASEKETVVLLHGMGRTRLSLKILERRLRKAGFETLNFPYSSRRKSVAEIAEDLHAYVREKVKTDTYHFVGHSLGNIIVREGFRQEYRPGLGRIVMLGPPNQPAQLAERLGGNAIFRFFTRDAGQKLGSPEYYVELPTPTVAFGVIAGDRGQRLTFKEPNDSIVSVESTKLEGMADHLVLHHSHSFMMNARDTAEACVTFLRHGKFFVPEE